MNKPWGFYSESFKTWVFLCFDNNYSVMRIIADNISVAMCIHHSKFGVN